MSAERITPYLSLASGELDSALRLYAWNIEISAAFYGPLQALEVTLRNALHRELAQSTGREEWWSSTRVTLDRTSADKVRAAGAAVRALHVTPTIGHIVAELSFGFWSSLLSSRHSYDVRLWRPSLHRAFPGYRGPRRPLYQDLYHLRRFRNRIAHHEPVHHRHLEHDHANVLRILGYMCGDTAAWVRDNDRVPDVLRRRRQVLDGSAHSRF
ncbi:hypothetical protein OIE66_00190 [Nonomuraea sp. NBC_01738]|uniref:hypothetical protein n=1 Tax=Nonomuraea sp. NBC_01738 TaxID=2976003 RepID=UPI002E0DAADC|nr:hypothetical protein OIE66_00190 [Nonomuraea sp. NBC_01738]